MFFRRRRQKMKTIIFVVVAFCIVFIILNLTLTGKLSDFRSDSELDLIERLLQKKAHVMDSGKRSKNNNSFDIEETKLTRLNRMRLSSYLLRRLGTEVNKDGNYSDVEFPPFVEYGFDEGPGEKGRPHRFDESSLSVQQKEEKAKDFKTHYFDEWISKEIAVHRSLEDVRSAECQSKEYSELPASSVVIVFHNEAWTTLLRSIHSVLDRTPPHLLEEIVLVDDLSTMDHLQQPLEKYLQPLEKVRLIRATNRLGLMQARNLGYVNTRGEVVIFLDSHIECFPGWYEPLVAPLTNNSKIVTFPVVDIIDLNTFGIVQQADRPVVGAVNIHTLSFTWMEADIEWNAGTDLLKSPAMPGGLYAISREWFASLGMYDPRMTFWGGENIELSFKVWMCGGSILLSRCSHVAHVFRHQSPVKELAAILTNSVRVAEVWMDEYKHFFYEKLAYNLGNQTDVSDRLELRRSLQCHDFDWYLTNVHSELRRAMDEHSMYCGQIKSISTDLCLEARYHKHSPTLAPCTLGNSAQVWMLRTEGLLISFESMLKADANTTTNNITKYTIQTARKASLMEPLTFEETQQFWDYDNTIQWLYHRAMDKCLGVEQIGDLTTLVLANCTDELPMRWSFQLRAEMRDDYKKLQDIWIDWTAGG